MKVNRRGFLELAVGGLVAGVATLSGCRFFNKYEPPELVLNYWLGLGQQYLNSEYNENLLPGVLGICGRMDAPFVGLSPEETQEIYDTNEAVKRTVEDLSSSLGIEQEKTVFYPIRDPNDRIPSYNTCERWIDLPSEVGKPAEFPTMGYKGMTSLYYAHECSAVYVASKDIFPVAQTRYFPALTWELSNTFGYMEGTSGQDDIFSAMEAHYADVISGG